MGQSGLSQDGAQFQPDDGDCRPTLRIAEVEELSGRQIDPDDVHTPGIFVQRIFQGDALRETRSNSHRAARRREARQEPESASANDCRRVARELHDGFYVNLGIGIAYAGRELLPAGIDVMLQSENGMLGVGPYPYEGEEDPDLINAGKETITDIPGCSLFFERGLVCNDSRRPHRPDRARRAGGG